MWTISFTEEPKTLAHCFAVAPGCRNSGIIRLYVALQMNKRFLDAKEETLFLGIHSSRNACGHHLRSFGRRSNPHLQRLFRSGTLPVGGWKLDKRPVIESRGWNGDEQTGNGFPFVTLSRLLAWT
jgi:hypothetical protein